MINSNGQDTEVCVSIYVLCTLGHAYNEQIYILQNH